jgi:hypothetical protein
MMQLIPLRGPHHCACWHRDASGNSRLHRVHHPLTRRAAPGRHREPRGTRWASASLVAPRARPGNQPPSLHPVHPRSPETDVRAAASSPVSHAARRRVETPRTWPPRIAVTDRRTLLAWTCATAGQIHAVITNLASSLQAPASAEVFSMVGKSLITSSACGWKPSPPCSAPENGDDPDLRPDRQPGRRRLIRPGQRQDRRPLRTAARAARRLRDHRHGPAAPRSAPG